MLLFGMHQKDAEVDELFEYLDDRNTADEERNLEQVRSDTSSCIEQSQIRFEMISKFT